MEQVFVGTELKFQVSITASGFDMGDDPFDIVLSCGRVTKTVHKNELIYDNVEGKYYMVVDTSDFGPGVLCATVVAQVPDTDFDDGYRKEVFKTALIMLKQ